MPVLRQVPRSEVTSDLIHRYYDRLFGEGVDPVATPGTATGTPGDWWTVFALAPDIFKHAVDGFAVYRHPARKIDPVLRELGQTRAGWVKGSQFVFSQHCKSLRGLGVSDEKIAAVPHWAVSDVFDDQERAVLAYADCLSQAARSHAGGGVRQAEDVLERRADPGIHLHHLPLRHARGDDPGAADGIRQPRRADRRGGRAQGLQRRRFPGRSASAVAVEALGVLKTGSLECAGDRRGPG